MRRHPDDIRERLRGILAQIVERADTLDAESPEYHAVERDRRDIANLYHRVEAWTRRLEDRAIRAAHDLDGRFQGGRYFIQILDAIGAPQP